MLTVGGCDTNDQMVGYSSRGPSIAGMYQHKPDLVAYTHFLGSKVVGMHLPDTGVSAACPVAAGCVAALRTQFKPSVDRSAQRSVPEAQEHRTTNRAEPRGWHRISATGSFVRWKRAAASVI